MLGNFEKKIGFNRPLDHERGQEIFSIEKYGGGGGSKRDRDTGIKISNITDYLLTLFITLLCILRTEERSTFIFSNCHFSTISMTFNQLLCIDSEPNILNPLMIELRRCLDMQYKNSNTRTLTNRMRAEQEGGICQSSLEFPTAEVPVW